MAPKSLAGLPGSPWQPTQSLTNSFPPAITSACDAGAGAATPAACRTTERCTEEENQLANHGGTAASARTSSKPNRAIKAAASSNRIVPVRNPAKNRFRESSLLSLDVRRKER